MLFCFCGCCFIVVCLGLEKMLEKASGKYCVGDEVKMLGYKRG